MKLAPTLFVLFLLAAGPNPPEAAVPYFTNVRDVQIGQPDQQNFFIVDEELWNHSRPDLGDLRLYDGQSPVQYAISEQRAGILSEEVDAKILNLGSVSGHAEFDLDMEGLPEYDRIRLHLDAHNFVATGSVSGGSAPGKASEVELPSSTLYDFTKEQLGSNSQLKLPTSSFRFLHIKLSPGILPQQVKGATIYNLREQKASWTKAGSCGAPQQKPRMTVITCDVPARVPLSRVTFQIDPAQVNFRRTVSVEDTKGQQIASGEITRVRVNRGGVLITSAELSVEIANVTLFNVNAASADESSRKESSGKESNANAPNSGALTVNIDNGDNPPLAITATEPFTLERRIYFDPQGKTALQLYYGDEKLSPPVYDYARFFHLEAMPAKSQLGAGAHNPEYAGRPDARPWSEQHTVVLWGAMLLAVLVLAVLALRGLRTETPR